MAPIPPIMVRPCNLLQKNASVSSTTTKECDLNKTHMCDTHHLLNSVPLPIIPKHVPYQHSMVSPFGSTLIHHARLYTNTRLKTLQAPTRHLSYTGAPTIHIHNSFESCVCLSCFLVVTRKDSWMSQDLRFQVQHPDYGQQQPYSLFRFLGSGIDDPWTSERATIIVPRVVGSDLDEVN
ncbi:hypothetical protein L211DRAFT_850529 [Terfezia boudieri ATCC MYA-4762]|uniref:Uncharacterized protein n=1 Tax=Terfezia boudieri ATCC MYA-4762 TaxID=1051890 RepID=A0A3N4LHZ0_9PEZI|nr:hypothetical protein L211DRAFT_850529 [Terfezia boudieri ATCC MYA-4762]